MALMYLELPLHPWWKLLGWHLCCEELWMGFADLRIDQIFPSSKAMMSKIFYHFHVVIDEPPVNISIRWAVFGFLSRRFPAGVHLPLRDFPNCKWLQLPTVTSTVTILGHVTRHLFREDSPFDFCKCFKWVVCFNQHLVNHRGWCYRHEHCYVYGTEGVVMAMLEKNT